MKTGRVLRQFYDGTYRQPLYILAILRPRHYTAQSMLTAVPVVHELTALIRVNETRASVLASWCVHDY